MLLPVRSPDLHAREFCITLGLLSGELKLMAITLNDYYHDAMFFFLSVIINFVTKSQYLHLRFCRYSVYHYLWNILYVEFFCSNCLIFAVYCSFVWAFVLFAFSVTF